METEKSTGALLCLLTVLLSAAAASGVSETELDAAMFALRAAGFNLFPNAISTTDLRYRLLTAAPNASFTLFSPPDPSLFTLDFTSPSANQYFLALLRHVSPLSLSSIDLLSLAQPIGPDEPCLIPTLMPNHSLRLRLTSESVMSVNGVRISSIDMYLGQGIVVHGIDRTLMENGSPIPDDYYAYVGSGHGPGSVPEIPPHLDPLEPASPAQHKVSENHHRPRRDHNRHRNRRRHNRHTGQDDNHARSVIV